MPGQSRHLQSYISLFPHGGVLDTRLVGLSVQIFALCAPLNVCFQMQNGAYCIASLHISFVIIQSLNQTA